MMALPALQQSDFAAFFIALHGVDPFPWQRRLLDDLVSAKWLDAEINPQQWPAAMALPTASGKTACIDIALFHLALQADSSHFPPEERTAPRRIFFCVDRRVIVDEAYDRARRIAAKLACALGQRSCDECRGGAAASKCCDRDVLKRVAMRLQLLASDGTAEPLACFQLRGGMFRDDAWATSPLQPTVICTTVDQLGSRLLFRGYGVSPRSASIHAGMAANDALILLDEAHCAEPFRQTLDAVRLFRGEEWCEPGHALKTPFAFVEMSATPRSDSKLFEVDDNDRKCSELSRRLQAEKTAQLIKSPHQTASPEFAEALVKQVFNLLGAVSAEKRPKRVAIMVNRVETARLVHERLRESSDCDTILMIGRMRPLDRDDLVRQWQPKLKATPRKDEQRETHEKPIVVVATQCLEVGANLDFDALITEAASLDALRQRFGRLNRLGRDTQCSAIIVAPKDAVTKDADDPIYGPAIANTWNWMHKHAQPAADGVSRTAATATTGAAKPRRTSGKRAAVAETPKVIDFGIAKLGEVTAADPPARECFAPAADAPVMLPAHLDLWCQTAPVPAPDPDVSIFLHGPQRGVPTVSVCWRADLGDVSQKWAEIVSLLPPSSPECMPVPLHLVRKWIKHEPAKPTDDTGDVEQAAQGDDRDDRQGNNGEPRCVLPWRGKSREKESETCPTNDPNDLRPGDVVVIPAAWAHTCSFGHLPGIPSEWTQQKDRDKENEKLRQPLPDCIATPLDRAEQANLIARRRLALRLTPQFVESWPDPRDDENRPVIPARCELLSLLQDPETRERLGEPDVAGQLKATLRDLSRQLKDGAKAKGVDTEWAWLRVLIAATTTRALRAEVVEHPAGGLVVRSPRRIGERALRAAGLIPGELEAGVGDEDERSLAAPRPVALEVHVSAVANQAEKFARAGGAAGLAHAVCRAALLHDHGKLDPRFQAYLLGAGCRAVNARAPLAKSGRSPTPAQIREDARRAGLPAGFRHEMLSMHIAEHANNDGKSLLDGLPDDLRDLVLHLIASHHGHARPFAPVVEDKTPPPLPAIELKGVCPTADASVRLAAIDARQRAEWEQRPAHRLDSGVCDRFWTLTRRYGWWGLAYLEAILRLADRAVSRDEQQHPSEGRTT